MAPSTVTSDDIVTYQPSYRNDPTKFSAMAGWNGTTWELPTGSPVSAARTAGRWVALAAIDHDAGASVAAGVQERLALGEPGLGGCGEDSGVLEGEVVACVADAGVGAVVVGPESVEEAGKADDAVSLSGEEADGSAAGGWCCFVGEGEAVCS